MNEIICPHCKKAFKIDEAGYADILKQVHNSEFEKQLQERLELAEDDKRNAVHLAESKITNESLKVAATKDAEIQALKAKLDAIAVEQKLAINEAVAVVAKERDDLQSDLELAEQQMRSAVELGESKVAGESQKVLAT